MAELFEEVVAILESRSATRALSTELRVDSEKAAGDGAVLAVPLLIAKLAEGADDPAGAPALLDALRAVDTAGLQDPGAAIEGRVYEPTGSELTELLIGPGRPQVAAAIAGEAGISDRSASAMLPVSAWAVVASIADRYGNRLDRPSLLSILEREQTDLLDGGWGPWLEAVDRRAAPLASMSSAPIADTRPGREAGDRPAPEYPPPLSRRDRLAAGTSRRSTPAAGATRRSALGTAPADGGSATSTMYAEREPLGPAIDDLADLASSRNRLLGLLAVAAVFLLGLAALVWFLSTREDSETGTGAVETDTTETTADDGSSADASGDADSAGVGFDESESEDVTAPVGEPQLAYDLPMDDPLGRAESTGLAELRFEPDEGQLCYTVSTEGMGTPYDGHVHVGPAGVKGGIVIDFGPVDNDVPACVPVTDTVLQAVVTDPANHYVEMHDPSEEFTIRAQLAESDGPPSEVDPITEFDPDGGGAITTIAGRTITLSGPVADQETMDRLVAEVAGLDEAEVLVVNDLVIEDGAPLPTGRFAVDADFLFDVDSDELSTNDPEVLGTMALLFAARSEWSLTVVGHTDSTGPEVYNLELSLRRADAVRDALVEFGVPAERLRTEGAGATDPVADNDTPEGRAQNRRIEFSIDRSR